jgi:serine/threonine protein kinase
MSAFDFQLPYRIALAASLDIRDTDQGVTLETFHDRSATPTDFLSAADPDTPVKGWPANRRLSWGRHSPSLISSFSQSQSTFHGVSPASTAVPSTISNTSILGRGAYACVNLVYDADGNKYAEKRLVTLSADKAQSAERELHFAQRYVDTALGTTPDSRRVHGMVDIVTAYTDDSEHTVHILMEYMDSGDASRLRGVASVEVISAVTSQVLHGLRHMHSTMHALHRDVKPENLLLSSSGRVALSDFGCSAVVEADSALEASDQVGTILYMSPERLVGQRHGAESDVWSLGVTVATLAIGRHPFVNTKAVRSSNERFWALAEVLKFTSEDAAEWRMATEAAVEASLADCDATLRDFVHGCTWRRDAMEDLMSHGFVAQSTHDGNMDTIRRHVSERKLSV